MRQQLEALKTQLQVVEQFETLFKSRIPSDYKNAMGTEQQPGPFVEVLKQAGIAFDNFDFAENDKRSALAKSSHIRVRTLSGENITPTDVSAIFENAVKIASTYVKDNSARSDSISKLVIELENLIKLQKEAVKKAIAEAKASSTLQRALHHKFSPSKIKAAKNDGAKIKRVNLAKKVAYYSGLTTLGTVGLSTTTASALMQFSPQFAMMVGVHLPVAALASIAVASLAMTAVAAYLAYRAYKLAQTVTSHTTVPSVESTPVVDAAAPAPTNPNRAAMLNYALIGSGSGLMAFAATMQFSPKLALMLGVNLSPVALAGIAAVGVLLMSVGLYRMCKARAELAPVVETTDSAPVVTCKDRLAQYATAGRNYANSWHDYFFKKAPAQDKTTENGVHNTVQAML